MTVRAILVADGDTDYDLMERAKAEDTDISSLPLEFLRPEEAGLAAIMAAKGHADGVMVLVDNDGDPRFVFPHDTGCPGCRECDARGALERIDWGDPFKRAAAIAFQAAETLLLSARSEFTPQIEAECFGKRLKTRLYGRKIDDSREMYDAFLAELNRTHIPAIRVRSYPRIKRMLRELSTDG